MQIHERALGDEATSRVLHEKNSPVANYQEKYARPLRSQNRHAEKMKRAGMWGFGVLAFKMSPIFFKV